jgi:Region found in RelA / SpoT proteins
VLGILLANKTEARRSCLTNDVDLIDQFVSRYRHEFDFFEQAGRLVALHLDTRLQASGIRAIVTSRAKNPKRLEEKVRQRAADRPYKSVEEVYADIVDLAGVRVALYFPGERNEVDKIIRDQFNLTTAKDFTGTSVWLGRGGPRRKNARQIKSLGAGLFQHVVPTVVTTDSPGVSRALLSEMPRYHCNRGA